MKVARDRRGALMALRDQASVIEVQEVRALSRDVWQQASAQAAQVDEETRAVAIKEQGARTRARNELRESYWQRAFGDESAFSRLHRDANIDELPVRACDLWRQHACVVRVRDLVFPSMARFRNNRDGNLGSALAQMLLRLQPFLRILEFHDSTKCRGVGNGCVACAVSLLHGALQQASVNGSACDAGAMDVEYCELRMDQFCLWRAACMPCAMIF